MTEEPLGPITGCKTYVEWAAQFNPCPASFSRNLYGLVRDHGIHTDPHNLSPIQPPKGPMKLCFMNAYNLAIEDDRLTYVEGFALNIIPIHHAWNIDREGRLVENTWKTPGVEYFGVPFKTIYVAEAINETGRYSLMFNPHFRRILNDQLSDMLPEQYLKSSCN